MTSQSSSRTRTTEPGATSGEAEAVPGEPDGGGAGMAVVTDMILGSGERLRGLSGCAPRSSAPVCAQGLRVSADATGHLPSLPGARFRFMSDQVGTMSFTHGRRGRMSTSNLVRVFTEQELEDRRSAVVAE
ncbi:hypothetical protein CHIBA101_1773 [Actinomyces sp. Chiba101]|nr:hypothetical protein CHIBA101_1773 [Actinomyces sp. Chiba101]GAV93544.1 hypothetical protein ADENT20671_0290 [Actinomyces denticolens]